jgi:putative ABC transport system ATP-binding protein
VTTGPEPLFKLDHVTVRGAGGPRLADVSVEIGTGATAVVGPSGAGKSTLLRLCNRLEVADSGTVRFRGDDVAALDPVALRRRVGMVFQKPTPFDGSVLANLRVGVPGLDAHGASALLRRVNLDEHFLSRDARSLSGGEAQRMCLARTIATGPEVLLLDEPTASLDGEARASLERLVCDLVEGGLPAIWVTHDLRQMRRVARTVVVLAAGRVVFSGTVDEVAAAAAATPALAGFLRDDDAG